MPSTKEIRGKIKSVQNTRKITKAMEMVAASKMRRAQERMRSCAFFIFEAATISIALVILRVFCTLLILARISLVPGMVSIPSR